jgi:type II restriction enzyme
MALKGNKGEWSEIYAFFKILGDTKLYNGDENLNKLENLFYPIIKILRQELNKNYEYTIEKDLVLVTGGEKEIRVKVSDFVEKSVELFKRIQKGKGILKFPDIESFMNSIHCTKLKAKSSDKTDIKIVIHDPRTGANHLLGFSIKSKLGGNSTLFNSNKDGTNFLFKINGINKSIADEVNAIPKFFYKKFEILYSYTSDIEFVEVCGPTLKNNLLYIDRDLIVILSQVVLIYYSSKKSLISEIIEKIALINPLEFDYSGSQDFYVNKTKKFLVENALGMKPGKHWKGKYDATGGYIVVKENGDVICYHFYEANKLQDYLFNNTCLDTPSVTRHKFGKIYEENGEYFMKLNLQIRFC